jgi:hypothetical protein
VAPPGVTLSSIPPPAPSGSAPSPRSTLYEATGLRSNR